jgi:hypothetical protein
MRFSAVSVDLNSHQFVRFVSKTLRSLRLGVETLAVCLRGMA